MNKIIEGAKEALAFGPTHSVLETITVARKITRRKFIAATGREPEQVTPRPPRSACWELDMFKCDECGEAATCSEDGEFLCGDCLQNRAERAWERQCQRYYGGEGPSPLRDQQIEARKFK
jgi:hypothetical protein